uniref:Uncharacterized protein n=1 Tax=Daphnia galeata TaxID=27404 RepID=A0A8J2S3E9_9CRUS|nr:unnamed protein product [Daphnia galeata]
MSFMLIVVLIITDRIFHSRQQFLFVAINNSSHWLAVKIKTLFTIQSQSKSVQVIFFVSFGFHYQFFDIFGEKGNVLVSNASWPEFFGLRYVSQKSYPRVRWVELDRPLKKQLDKHAQEAIYI